jgi:hypothetical protein
MSMSAHAVVPRHGTPGDGVREDVLLTILIPCLNEAETLNSCIRKAQTYLGRAGFRGEVLVADNGSTDGSIEIAERLGARIVTVPVRGYGATLQGGIAAAHGRYIVMGDGDDSYDFSDLSAFVRALESGADLVMGNRFKGGIAAGAMPLLHRYLGNPVLSWLGRLLYGAPIGDFHCGLRGFRRDAIIGLGLRTTGMEFASEMVVQAALSRLSISEVPTGLSKDGRSRPPHLRTWRDGWRHLRFLLLHSPRWAFCYPGLLILALGVTAVLALLPGPLAITSSLGLDIRTFMIACLAILVGVQALTFGVIARRFAARNAVLPAHDTLQRFFDRLTMEHLLLCAAGTAALGVVGLLGAILAWGSHNFGALAHGEMLRPMILSVTAIVAAVQLAFSALLLGVLDLPGSGDAREQLARLRARYPRA